MKGEKGRKNEIRREREKDGKNQERKKERK
jgi:hypothetical protein